MGNMDEPIKKTMHRIYPKHTKWPFEVACRDRDGNPAWLLVSGWVDFYKIYRHSHKVAAGDPAISPAWKAP